MLRLGRFIKREWMAPEGVTSQLNMTLYKETPPDPVATIMAVRLPARATSLQAATIADGSMTNAKKPGA
jgi:hypothetical protein